MTQENLLLREDGYPHLPLPEVAQICQHCNGKKWIFRGHGEDTECEHCLDNEPFDVEALRQENAQLKQQSDRLNCLLQSADLAEYVYCRIKCGDTKDRILDVIDGVLKGGAA